MVDYAKVYLILIAIVLVEVFLLFCALLAVPYIQEIGSISYICNSEWKCLPL